MRDGSGSDVSNPREARGETSPEDADYRRVLHRSQFVLGPSFADGLPSARRLSLRRGLHLTVHRDLSVYHAQRGGKSLVLLGFMLDPDDTEATDADIVETLVERLLHCKDICRLTARFGGRWVLIVDDGQRTLLLTDPIGSRQVFYADPQSVPDLWCASQPGLIAEVLELRDDPTAREFLDSVDIRADPERWWPGDSSLYREIKRLVPNHYLDLATRQARRYWPIESLGHLALSTCVERSSRLLRGLLESAANRFDLVVSLTAGWDSRVVLAACKAIRHRVSYVTVRHLAGADWEPDIAVSAALLHRLGLKHRVVSAATDGDERFRAVFAQHATCPHGVWMEDAEALFEAYRLRKVVVTGSAGEIARVYYRGLPWYTGSEMTGEKLAFLTGMGRQPFAVGSFGRWLWSVRRPYRLSLLDLFYWEQRTGSWLAMCQSEFDVAWRDILTPFNCRLLLTTMLAVDERWRKPPGYALFRELISTLWSDVLLEPINPHKAVPVMTSVKRAKSYHMRTIKFMMWPYLKGYARAIRGW